MMPVNKSGLGILNPVTSAKDNDLSPHQEIAELIRAVTGVGAFYNCDELLALREERRNRKKNWDETNDATLKGIFGDLIVTNLLLILRAKITCA